ncbi:MAG: selenide, water dikinase SelD [Bacteroidetes bacterium]|nr:selenide, water dikinase SelD [Bacteroidota bacterium]
MEGIKLTKTVSCGGCAGKVNPIDLYSVLEKIHGHQSDKLLIGYDKGDDACVYKQSDESALVFTTDFIAPLVDNPYDFGKIAATNALSDIYAMGGTPLMALNVVCFDEKLGFDTLEKILQGGAEVCKAANVLLCGGHTVKSPEIRYGLSVIGHVHPNKIVSNANGKAGDILVVTKPLGTGILCQALKYNLLSESLIHVLTNQLCELNDKVGSIMQQVGIRCATDVTGFGLAGHLHKLTRASNCGATLYLDKLPCLPEVLELASDNIHSGILSRNEEYVDDFINGNYKMHKKSKLLFDPQTSGGLLIAIRQNVFHDFERLMVRSKLNFFIIGELISSVNNEINVI